MLSVFFGDMDESMYGPSYFKYNYDPVWFEDTFVQRMMKDVDHSVYRGGDLIESDILGPIPPERLSGGLMTLILIYEKPDMIFDATSCGDNCARWLLEIGNKKDVTVQLNYLMKFPDEDSFSIRIANDDKVVSSARDYTLEALELLP